MCGYMPRQTWGTSGSLTFLLDLANPPITLVFSSQLSSTPDNFSENTFEEASEKRLSPEHNEQQSAEISDAR